MGNLTEIKSILSMLSILSYSKKPRNYSKKCLLFFNTPHFNAKFEMYVFSLYYLF